MLPVLLVVSVLHPPDLSPVAMESPCRELPVTLVSNGRACAPIVTADGKRERWAAHYLASAIREMTGVRPEVRIETAPSLLTNAPALHLAPSDDTDTFRVITKNGVIRFLGRSDFAVFDWCERILGVRHYGDCAAGSGRTVLPTAELIVPAVDYADWPVFSYRRESSSVRKIAHRTFRLGGMHRGGVNVHQPARWYADPDVRTNHPAIFARQPDGTRGNMPLLCYGNPETLAYYEKRIDEHIAGLRDSGGIVDTNRQVITVSHWDVLLECSCPHCRRLFDPSRGMTGSGSPIIWGHFLKRLAQWARAAHPDYLISFLPYLNVCDVPPGLDLTGEGNCEAMLCSMPGLAMFKEPSVREREEALIRDWALVTGRKVLNWHYDCWPREFTSAPYLYGRTIVEHYRRMAPFAVGTFICGGGSSASECLTAYVWHKCLWNPDIRVEAVYDVFAQRLFGVAARPMRQLMDLQEAGWARPWPWPHGCEANTFGHSYPHEDVERMKDLLEEAAALVRGDARLSANVRWYAADFARFFADEARYRQAPASPDLVFARAGATPRVDGDFDEPGWAAAPERAFVAAFGTQPPKRRTFVRSLRTDDGLCFAFRCLEPDMPHLAASPSYGELQKQDTLEIFFDPSGSRTGTCYRLMFDVANRLTATASDSIWTACGVQSAVRRGDGEWRLEVYLPFASVPAACSDAEWHGNFVRWHPGPAGERERTRLVTRESTWNQDRDAFCRWRITPAPPEAK